MCDSCCLNGPYGIFQMSKFPDTLSFVIINVLAKFDEISQICRPYKLAQCGCIPPKIKCKILANIGSQTTRDTPGDYFAS